MDCPLHRVGVWTVVQRTSQAARGPEGACSPGSDSDGEGMKKKKPVSEVESISIHFIRAVGT